MSLYVNNASNEPSSIYYNGNELNTVYFNGNLVWEKVVGDDWQALINTVEQKANGAITEWPNTYYVGKELNFELEESNDFWGNYITAKIIKQNDKSLVFAIYPKKYFTFYDADNLTSYIGYKNSNPDRLCCELEELLPFKDNLVGKSFNVSSYTVNKAENNLITDYTNNGSIELTRKVFIPTFFEIYNATNARNAEYYFWDDDMMGNPSYRFGVRAGSWGTDLTDPSKAQYTNYGVSTISSTQDDFTDTSRMVALFEIGA